MQAHLTEGEEPISGKRYIVLVLKPNQRGEARLFDRLRAANVEKVPLIWSKRRNYELRLAMPVEIAEGELKRK